MVMLRKPYSQLDSGVQKPSRAYQFLTVYDREQAASELERKRKALRKMLIGCPPYKDVRSSDSRREDRARQIRLKRGDIRVESLFGEQSTIAGRLQQRAVYLAYASAFERWLDDCPELRAALQISRKAYCSAEYRLVGFPPILSVRIGFYYEHYVFRVTVAWNEEYFDDLISLDIYPERTATGHFYSKMSCSENRETYASLEDMWISEAFIEFKAWYENRLLKAESLTLYGGVSLSVAMIQKPKSGRKHDPFFERLFIASFPLQDDRPPVLRC